MLDHYAGGPGPGAPGPGKVSRRDATANQVHARGGGGWGAGATCQAGGLPSQVKQSVPGTLCSALVLQPCTALSCPNPAPRPLPPGVRPEAALLPSFIPRSLDAGVGAQQQREELLAGPQLHRLHHRGGRQVHVLLVVCRRRCGAGRGGAGRGGAVRCGSVRVKQRAAEARPRPRAPQTKPEARPAICTAAVQLRAAQHGAERHSAA